MEYLSTRDASVRVSGAEAIAWGISPEGGLFLPESVPSLEQLNLLRLSGMDYVERAQNILADFLTDFTDEEIYQCVQGAYGSGNFAHDKVAPVVKLSDAAYLLELWHGPTCAFKDMALQLLPHLLTHSLRKVGNGREAAILVATSGDTGKAALEGFRDVEGTRILVFYPHGGVSNIQYLQMATQQGGNVGVCGVRGNFDDTQTAVKRIFTDPAMRSTMGERNILFSSANSINWGRLVPQIVYYISAYCDMVKSGEITAGDHINVCVPTGNFGNILAAYYAKNMGLPIAQLICASNVNNVLTDFIRTGIYDRRREFVLTSSPSMDILISSNLERLLFTLSGQDGEQVSSWMRDLSEQGIYQIGDEAKERLQTDFYGGFCSEEGTARTIRETFQKNRYLADTHTAVALAVHDDYVRETGDTRKTLIASTANPYKFVDSILGIFDLKVSDNDFENLRTLERFSGMPIPRQILQLEQADVRFQQVCDQDEMAQIVLDMMK